jgi:DNA adenine methylase
LSTSTRSLLRYPGSKARFASFIAKAITLNAPRPRLLVEPFCGGASVSLALLESGVVDAVAINDVDPLISQLWSVVFSKAGAGWLADQVLQVPLSVEEWKRQKALRPTNRREAALKCLYLNRTSFNGIIHQSGPLGGWTQQKTDIGVRFNRERISKRIVALSELRGQVTVGQEGWRSFCQRFSNHSAAIFYLDPPYYHRAEQLYGHVFDADRHEELRDFLKDFEPPWLLSYDDAPEVRELYEDVTSKARVIDNTYSTHPLGGCAFIGRELVYTNMRRLPAPAKANSDHVGITVKAAGSGRARKASSVEALRFPISASAVASEQI